MEHQWQAYHNERKTYNRLLYKYKSEYIWNEVLKHKGDSKHLYKLVSSLTGIKTENPLPECSNDFDLAGRFASYFLEKIQIIRQQLDNHPVFQPPVNKGIINVLDHFTNLSEVDVRKIVSKMQSKSCELDILPTFFIKNNIGSFLGILTKIINTSLQTGYFSSEWKTAILHPLLKKANLDLESKNYRPVSNSSFISKVTE